MLSTDCRTQECSEYDLRTNFVKFMQQTTLTLSEGDSSVWNSCLQQFIYLINSPKVTAMIKSQVYCILEAQCVTNKTSGESDGSMVPWAFENLW